MGIGVMAVGGQPGDRLELAGGVLVALAAEGLLGMAQAVVSWQQASGKSLPTTGRRTVGVHLCKSGLVSALVSPPQRWSPT